MTPEQRFVVFRQFLEEEQCFQQFLNNCTNYKQGYENDFNHLMDKKEPYNVISNAFTWNRIPEGYTFWQYIAEKFRDKFIVL